MKNAVLLQIIDAVAPKDIQDDIMQIRMDEALASSHRRDANTIARGAERNIDKLLTKIGVTKPSNNGVHECPCPHCGKKPSDERSVVINEARMFEEQAQKVTPRGWDKV